MVWSAVPQRQPIESDLPVVAALILTASIRRECGQATTCGLLPLWRRAPKRTSADGVFCQLATSGRPVLRLHYALGVHSGHDRLKLSNATGKILHGTAFGVG